MTADLTTLTDNELKAMVDDLAPQVKPWPLYRHEVATTNALRDVWTELHARGWERHAEPTAETGVHHLVWTRTRPTVNLWIAAAFMDDHLDRLYEATFTRQGITNRVHRHIDSPECVIEVVERKGNRMRALFSPAAVRELRDDADYQANPGDGSGNPAARRVLTSLARQYGVPA